MKEIKKPILELADKVREDFTTDKSGSGVVPESTYMGNLYEGLTPEICQLKENYDTDYVAAVTLVSGEEAIKAMANDSSIERFITEAPMGHKNNLTVTVDRSKEYKNYLSKDDKDTPIVKHGVVNANYEVKAGNNGGQLKVVRSHISELAFEKLANK
jgi:hypothetical protein